MIVGPQIRAARALLSMSQDELAVAAGLTPQAIRKIESGEVQPREGTLADIERVFHECGIEFLDNNGVRQKSNLTDVYEGVARFSDFYDFLYAYMRDHGGEICLNVYDERIAAKYRINPHPQRQRMRDLVESGKVSYRILANKADFSGDQLGVTYRQLPADNAPPTACYTFGECLALISFQHTTPPYVVVIRSAPIAQVYQQAFEATWEKAKPFTAEEAQKIKQQTEG